MSMFTEVCQDDVHTIIHKFTLLAEPSWENFIKLWIDMKFGYVFTDCVYLYELQELSETLLCAAKHYLLNGKSAVEKSGGLYLTYSLYFKQPVKYTAKVRITVQEVSKFNELWNNLRFEETPEEKYLLTKLYVCDAFKFVCLDKVFDIEKYKKTRNLTFYDVIETYKTQVNPQEFIPEAEYQECLMIENDYKKKCKEIGLGNTKAHGIEWSSLLPEKTPSPSTSPSKSSSKDIGIIRQSLKQKAFETFDQKHSYAAQILNRSYESDTSEECTTD